MLYTYEDIASRLSTTRDALYGVASLHPELFEPASVEGGIYRFSAEAVEKIAEWWEAHSRFRVSSLPTDEPAYSIDELATDHKLPFSTIQYYRRRYGMLYPDFYSPNPNGRGRPIAMLRKSTVEEWRAWVDAGRPEPAYARIKSVVLDQRSFQAIVQFADGTVAGLIDDEWRISPPPDEEEVAKRYIRFATRQVAQKRYAQKWIKPKAAP